MAKPLKFEARLLKTDRPFTRPCSPQQTFYHQIQEVEVFLRRLLHRRVDYSLLAVYRAGENRRVPVSSFSFAPGLYASILAMFFQMKRSYEAVWPRFSTRLRSHSALYCSCDVVDNALTMH